MFTCVRGCCVASKGFVIRVGGLEIQWDILAQVRILLAADFFLSSALCFLWTLSTLFIYLLSDSVGGHLRGDKECPTFRASLSGTFLQKDVVNQCLEFESAPSAA